MVDSSLWTGIRTDSFTLSLSAAPAQAAPHYQGTKVSYQERENNEGENCAVGNVAGLEAELDRPLPAREHDPAEHQVGLERLDFLPVDVGLPARVVQLGDRHQAPAGGVDRQHQPA